MRTVRLLLFVWGIFAVTTSADEAPFSQPFELQAVLLAPISTQFSIKGDLVSARVSSPPRYAGAILEGEIDSVRKGGGKVASVQLRIHALWIQASKTPISATLVRVANSHGQADSDETGSRLVQAKSKAGKRTPFIDLSVAGPEIAFAPGSVMVLSVARE